MIRSVVRVVVWKEVCRQKRTSHVFSLMGLLFGDSQRVCHHVGSSLAAITFALRGWVVWGTQSKGGMRVSFHVGSNCLDLNGLIHHRVVALSNAEGGKVGCRQTGKEEL